MFPHVRLNSLMQQRCFCHSILSSIAIGALLIAGCTGPASTGPSAEGRALLLESEPADAGSVVDLKSAITVGIAPPDGSALLIGKVLGGQDWETDQAAFLVRDLGAEAAEEHAHGEGDHSDCAFCQAQKKKDMESLALVRIVDDSGQVIAADARKLLGLQENDVVVGQGSGELLEDGTLVFSAQKIFIRL